MTKKHKSVAEKRQVSELARERKWTVILVPYAFSARTRSNSMSFHAQVIPDRLGGVHPVSMFSPTVLALERPDPPRTRQIWRSESESQEFSKMHHSGSSASFGTLLSFAQDLVQARRHVVGPGGRTVIPLQVFTWDQVPAKEQEEQDEQTAHRAAAAKRKESRDSAEMINKKICKTAIISSY